MLKEDYEMIHIPRSIVLAFLIVTLWTGILEATEAAEPVASIMVEQPTYEFGTVSQGDVVKHDFRVFNRGSAPLNIKGVKPG